MKQEDYEKEELTDFEHLTKLQREHLHYYCFCRGLYCLTSSYNITTLRAALFNDNSILRATECRKKHDAFLIALAIEKYYEPQYIENRDLLSSGVKSKHNLQLNISIYEDQKTSNKDIEKMLIKILEADDITVNKINIL